MENTGKVPLTHVSINIKTVGGIIESAALEQSPGIVPNSRLAGPEYQAVVERMLPAEWASVSVLATSNAPNMSLELGVRSNEVRGSSKSDTVEKDDAVLVPALLTAFAAATTMGVFIITLVFGRRSRGINFVSEMMGRQDFKSDIITYIFALSQVVPLTDEFYFRSNNISYRRAADIFLAFGLRADQATNLTESESRTRGTTRLR